MKIPFLRALPLVMLASFLCMACRPVASDPLSPATPTDSIDHDSIPLPPGDSLNVRAVWSFTADYTEHPSMAFDAPWEMLKVGLRVGERLDSLIGALGKPAPVLYLVLEFTDTVSSPSCHYLPACWQDVSPGAELADTIVAYTTAVLQQARSLGVEVAYVQLSRCISNGFLWASSADQLYPAQPMSKNPDGWNRFGQYLSAAGKAVRAVYPDAKIVLQTDQLGDAASTQQKLANLLLYWDMLGVEYDVVSFYYNPALQGGIPVLRAALEAVDTEVLENRELHFETCYPCSALPVDGSLSSKNVGYPYSSSGQKAYLADCFDLLQTCFPASDDAAKRYFIYRYASSMDYYQLVNTNYLNLVK